MSSNARDGPATINTEKNKHTDRIKSHCEVAVTTTRSFLPFLRALAVVLCCLQLPPLCSQV